MGCSCHLQGGVDNRLRLSGGGEKLRSMAGAIIRINQRDDAGAVGLRRAVAVLVAEENGRLLPSVGFTLLLPTLGGRSVQRR